jgi:cytochrome c biogenesis protein
MIIILLSICSIFIVQVPHEIGTGSSGYYRWIEEFVRPDYGFWTDVLTFLGFFSVFHSLLFLSTVVLLMLNILLCTVKRLPPALAALRVAGTGSASVSFPGTLVIRLFNTTATAASMATTNIFMKKGWRVRETILENGILDTADKYAFSRIGTILSHLSLVLLVLGFMLGSVLGFSDDNFLVAEDTMRDIGHGTGLALGLVSFGIEQWPDGSIKEYRSQVVLYKEGQPVDTEVIKVNYPISYNGIKFYQSYYGLAPVIQVTDSAGAAIAGGPVALVGTIEDQSIIRPVGRLVLPGTGLTAYIIGPAINTADPVIGPNQVGVELYQDNMTAPSSWMLLDSGTDNKTSSLTFFYPGQSYFSVFKVKSEPGIWLVWIAFILFTSGIVMTFFLPFRRVFIRINQEAENVIVSFKLSGLSGSRANDEFTGYAKEISAKIPGQILSDN